MKPWAQELARTIVHAAFAATLLAGAEIAIVVLCDRALFLSGAELMRFARVSWLCAVSLTVPLVLIHAALLGLSPSQKAAVSARGSRYAPATLALVTFLGSGWALWLLTAGRRVKDLPGRPFFVLIGAALTAFAAVWLARHIARAIKHGDQAQRSSICTGLLIWSLSALWIDAAVLRRLYPAFHLSLALSVWLSFSVLPLLWLSTPTRMRGATWLAALSILAAVAAPFQLHALATAPNLRFAVGLAAPLTGKLLRGFGSGDSTVAASPALSATALAASSSSTRPGLDLRGDDVLLITIDALRADRLRAYGGHGLTPAMDALARESVVFAHAYTATPHTSYALGSLLTGKYLRPVLSLPNAPTQHATLPRLLRRYGYRTAGFYPPAIFFVDQERFKDLQADHFGFEYVKQMFAPADQRVEQVGRYLDRVEPGHPVLLWVHFFEPHEPYEPPVAFQRGSELVDLYDGEVAAADAALGKLVQAVRARRPRTTVIVTADHGEEFGDHGGFHHGTTLYEEQVHVPLLWSSPGKTVARVINAPVELVDVVPTLLSALGVPRDARMRGDDLGALLLGDPAPATLRAFASIDDFHMWSDGHFKIICDQREAGCRLFDLLRDPHELHEQGGSEPGALASLQSELAQFVASLPQVEAVAMQSGGGWPKALARARLGDASAGPELLPLLGAERADVRAEAVRAVAALHLRQALQVIATLRSSDSDATVRAEAALSALALGDTSAEQQAEQVLASAVQAGDSQLELARRAALALPPGADSLRVRVLSALAADDNSDEAMRGAAVVRLAAAHSEAAIDGLLPVLANVRLRPAVVRSLSALGGPRVAEAIASAFLQERYPEARAAEAEALLRLHDPRLKKLVLRFLGTETGIPDGVSLLLQAVGPFCSAWGCALDLRASGAGGALLGSWNCASASGCRPGEGARLVFPQGHAPGGEARLILQLDAVRPEQYVELAGERYVVPAGATTLSVTLPAVSAARVLAVAASAGTSLTALAIVPRTQDIAPPPPRAYDAGVDASP